MAVFKSQSGTLQTCCARGDIYRTAVSALELKRRALSTPADKDEQQNSKHNQAGLLQIVHDEPLGGVQTVCSLHQLGFVVLKELLH